MLCQRYAVTKGDFYDKVWIKKSKGSKMEQAGQAVFTQLVGQVVEDFETGDFSKFVWESTNAKNWIIENTMVYEGAFASSQDWSSSFCL